MSGGPAMPMPRLPTTSRRLGARHLLGVDDLLGIDAPRPPYSAGQVMPTQRAAASCRLPRAQARHALRLRQSRGTLGPQIIGKVGGEPTAQLAPEHL